MKTFQVITPSKVVEFKFPTSLKELSSEYLKAVTANVEVANHYSLVGIIYHEKLANIIMTYKQKKQGFTTGVVPIFIKAGKTDNEFIAKAKIKDKLIIPSTQLSLGHHVAAPKNTLSVSYFTNLLSKDIGAYQRAIQNGGDEECFFVEFKLVPNSDIVGLYSSTEYNVDNIYTKVKDNNS